MEVLTDGHDSEIPHDTLQQVEARKRSIEFIDGNFADCDARPLSEYKKIKYDSFCPRATLQTLGHKIDGECYDEVELQVLAIEDGHEEDNKIVPHCKMPWYAAINQIIVGWSFHAGLLKKMPGLFNLDDTFLDIYCIRRLSDTATCDNSKGMKGFFMLNDVTAALNFTDRASASRHAKNLNMVNCDIAPSLIYTNAYTDNGNSHAMVSYVDLLCILMGLSTMHFLRRDGVTALVDRYMSRMNIPGPVEEKEQTMIHRKSPWYINQVVVGWVFHAALLKEMLCLHCLDDSFLVGKCFRWFGDTRIDENGNIMNGFFMLSDVMGALGCFKYPKSAHGYVKNKKYVNREVTPSVMYIDACHDMPGTHHTMVSYADLLVVLVGHSTMHFLRRNAVIALIDRDVSRLDKLPLSQDRIDVYAETDQRCMTYVNAIIEHCDTIPIAEYERKKTKALCVCGKLEILCRVHGGSALCVVCKIRRLNSEFEMHCVECFNEKYPEDPRSQCPIGYKRAEICVREAIDIAFDGFIHNKTIRGETEKRIDHRLLIGNTILAVETDEFAHQNYSETKEKERYEEFLTKTSYKFVFIRFNCDANRESGNAKTDLKHKLPILLHTITTQMSRIRHGQNTQRLEILKLFCCTFCAKHGRHICTCKHGTSSVWLHQRNI